MDEKIIERMLKRRVEEAIPGAKCLKFVSPGYTGVPDRIILLPGGSVVFVELKRPGKEPRQRQLFVQSRFRRLGFTVAGCVDSPEAVGQVVQMCKDRCCGGTRGYTEHGRSGERIRKGGDAG